MILTVFWGISRQKIVQRYGLQLAEHEHESQWRRKELNTTPLKIEVSNRHLFFRAFSGCCFRGSFNNTAVVLQPTIFNHLYSTLPVNKHRVWLGTMLSCWVLYGIHSNENWSWCKYGYFAQNKHSWLEITFFILPPMGNRSIRSSSTFTVDFPAIAILDHPRA